MGAGFALPYATMMIEAQKLWPVEPARPTSMLTMLGTGVAIPIVPFLGSLLDDGKGDIAFVALGVFVLIAGLLNIKPAGVPLAAPEPAAGARAPEAQPRPPLTPTVIPTWLLPPLGSLVLPSAVRADAGMTKVPFFFALTVTLTTDSSSLARSRPCSTRRSRSRCRCSHSRCRLRRCACASP